MDEKKFKNLWLISIVVILFLFSLYLLYIREDESVGESPKEENYTIVTNYNKFYTVNSCVYRYLSYLQGNDASSLLKVLDDDFVSKNSLNESNVYNYLTAYDGNVNFNSRKMYEEKISNDITMYYVYGYVERDIMDSFPEQIDAYYIVKLDEKNQVFTIQPYNGDIFK